MRRKNEEPDTPGDPEPSPTEPSPEPSDPAGPEDEE